MTRFYFSAFFVAAFLIVACGDSTIDNSAQEAVEEDPSCTTKVLKDKSGVKVICDGDSVGVVLYGKNGKDGKDGADGKSAYELSGFDGTLEEWLGTLKGADGKSCKTKEVKDGIQVTCGKDDPVTIKNGIDGKDGKDGKDGADGKSAYELSGFDGTLEEWLGTLKGADGKSCKVKDVADGVQITCGNDSPVTILNGKDGKDGKDGADGKSAYELSGFDGTVEEWIESLKGKDGKSCTTKKITDGVEVKCGDDDPVTIKNGKDGEGCTVTNTESAMKIVCGKDSVTVSLTGADGKTRYICADKSCSTWREATDIEKDTMGWGHDFKEGAVRNGRINTEYTYVYENKNWRLGTKLDSLLVKAGGSACMKAGDTSKVKYDKVYYVCTADTVDVIRKWVKAPDLYNDTYEARGECKAKGKLDDGTIIAGRVNTDKKYVCDGDVFRLADKTEISGNKGCTSYNRDTLLILANQYSYYKCTKNGWSFTLEKLNTGTVKDSRDNQVYKTIGVKGQMWMAENLKIDYKLPQKNDADTIVYGNVCNEDSCEIYGRFYSWAMAMDSAGLYSKNGKGCGYGVVCTPTYPVRGVCLEGWHLPTVEELQNLFISIEGSAKNIQAQGYEEWSQATDKYGFSALPAGIYGDDVGFVHVGKNAYFWSSSFERTTLADSVTAGIGYLYINNVGVMREHSVRVGMTVRCVKDPETK